MTEYIRGWRQLKTFYMMIIAIKRLNWNMFKREVEILTGYAKPYIAVMYCAVCKSNFDPKLWDGTILKKPICVGNFVCPMCTQLMKEGYEKIKFLEEKGFTQKKKQTRKQKIRKNRKVYK